MQNNTKLVYDIFGSTPGSNINSRQLYKNNDISFNKTQNIENNIEGRLNNIIGSLKNAFPLLSKIVDKMFQRERQSSQEHLQATTLQKIVEQTFRTNILMNSVLIEQNMGLDILHRIDQKLGELLERDQCDGKKTGGEPILGGRGGSQTPIDVNKSIARKIATSTAIGSIAALSPLGIDKILAMTGKLETGTRGSGTVVRDANNSHSYGLLGLNSGANDTGGSIHDFIEEHPELELTARPGSDEFERQWKNLAENQPELLKNAEREYYRDHILGGVQERLKKAGLPENIANDPQVAMYFSDREVQQGTGSTLYPRTRNRMVEALEISGDNPTEFLQEFSKIDMSEKSMREDFPSALRSGVYGLPGHINRVEGRLYGSLGTAFEAQDFQPGRYRERPVNNVQPLTLSGFSFDLQRKSAENDKNRINQATKPTTTIIPQTMSNYNPENIITPGSDDKEPGNVGVDMDRYIHIFGNYVGNLFGIVGI